MALLAAGFAATFALDPWQWEKVSDIPLYRGYADLFLDGNWPYRDIGFEYPPLAAPLMALPGLVSLDLDTYRIAFAVLTFALAAGVVLSTGSLTKLTGGGERTALIAIAAAPLVTGAMIRTHFDLAPVLCLVAGLAAIAATRPRTGFALLAIGGALKLFPLVAAVTAAAWLLGRGERRAAAEGIAVAAGVAAVAVAVAVALSPDGAWNTIDYHLERPIQIESLPATALNAIDAAGAAAPDAVNSHRSDGLEHAATDALSVLFAGLLAAAVGALAVAAHRIDDPRGLALTGLGSAAAFATLGKVLSPQFMLWLLPLAALAWAWRMHALAAVTTAAIAATLVWFPERYFDLVDRDTFPLVAVAVRNALLAAMLALLARELVRASRAAAGSTAPGRPGPPRSARR